MPLRENQYLITGGLKLKKTRTPEKCVVDYFTLHQQPMHKQYLAMRRFFIDQVSAETVAEEFNYKVSTIYTLARDFRKRLSECPDGEDPFFLTPKSGGRKPNVVVNWLS